MNAKNLKEWLLDVPDNAILVAMPADELPENLGDVSLGDVSSSSAIYYTVEPIYFEADQKIVFVFGI